MTPYPIVIQKEYFVVQDARPLYHWPEKEKPLTKVEMMRLMIAENKLEAERLRLQQLREEEEAKRKAEEGEDEESEEDDEDDGEERVNDEDGDGAALGGAATKDDGVAIDDGGDAEDAPGG